LVNLDQNIQNITFLALFRLILPGRVGWTAANSSVDQSFFPFFYKIPLGQHKFLNFLALPGSSSDIL